MRDLALIVIAFCALDSCTALQKMVPSEYGCREMQSSGDNWTCVYPPPRKPDTRGEANTTTKELTDGQ